MILVVFTAETVPKFGVLLELVGGSLVCLMALIFPVVFNFYLTAGNVKYEGAIAESSEEPLSFAEWNF